jgi:hypothetical protein
MSGSSGPDLTHAKAMERGSAALLEALKKGRTVHDRLIGNGAVRGGDRSGQTSKRQTELAEEAERVGRRMASKDRALDSVVTRDPCPRCGTRMDIGCKHRRAA